MFGEAEAAVDARAKWWDGYQQWRQADLPYDNDFDLELRRAEESAEEEIEMPFRERRGAFTYHWRLRCKGPGIRS